VANTPNDRPRSVPDEAGDAYDAMLRAFKARSRQIQDALAPGLQSAGHRLVALSDAAAQYFGAQARSQPEPRSPPPLPRLRGSLPAPPPPRLNVRLGPLGSGADIEVKPEARLGAFGSEMTRVYPDVLGAWRASGGPRPVITSGNDGVHRRDSRHYRNQAMDLRANNVGGAQARQIRDRLSGRLGADYDVIYETFPHQPSNNHIHLEYDPD